MRSLLLSALLVTMPFSGMRVICLDAPSGAGTVVTPSAVDDCERICARHHDVSSDTSASNCVLTADACALIAFATTIAVGPEQPPAGFPVDVSRPAAGAARSCAQPDLPHRVPPPKLQIL